MSIRLSFQEFKKILHNTFIWIGFDKKKYMNANIMNTQIFYFFKYDLNGY